MANCNVNDDSFEKMNRENMSDVVLVKKMYADKSVRNRRRKFKLRHLDADGMDVTSVNRDYTDFLEDLEEDPAFRQNIVCSFFFLNKQLLVMVKLFFYVFVSEYLQRSCSNSRTGG